MFVFFQTPCQTYKAAAHTRLQCENFDRTHSKDPNVLNSCLDAEEIFKYFENRSTQLVPPNTPLSYKIVGEMPEATAIGTLTSAMQDSSEERCKNFIKFCSTLKENVDIPTQEMNTKRSSPVSCEGQDRNVLNETNEFTSLPSKKTFNSNATSLDNHGANFIRNSSPEKQHWHLGTDDQTVQQNPASKQNSAGSRMNKFTGTAETENTDAIAGENQRHITHDMCSPQQLGLNTDKYGKQCTTPSNGNPTLSKPRSEGCFTISADPPDNLSDSSLEA